MTRYTHPRWCGQGHYCSHAGHRSAPVPLRGRRGVTAVVSLVAPHDGRPALELTLRVRLAGRSDTARSREAGRLLAAVARALTQELNR